jgi:putative IMPACT (imprinted ancient) family translation regulator
MQNLDSFIQHSRPPPVPLATSQEIRDRGSLFVATIYRAATPSGAQAVVQHVKHIVHQAKPASHEISAWRCMVLKHGRTGLTGPEDFEVKEGSADDGEQWAGGKVLKVLRTEGVMDAVVIVSRW